MTDEEKHALEIECAAIVDEFPECDFDDEGECRICGPDADPTGRYACQSRVDEFLGEYTEEVRKGWPDADLVAAIGWLTEEYSFPWHESPFLIACEYIDVKGEKTTNDQP